MNEVANIRAAITTNGGTPTSWAMTGALRQLVTTYGGTPTKYSVNGLLREAVSAVGGTPTKWALVPVLRELLTAMGTTVTSFRPYDLWQQLGGAVSGPRVMLSSTSVSESATIGTTVGTLSVINHPSGGSGWTFAETADPDNKFTVSGANLNTSATLNYEAATSHSVTITASKSAQTDIVQVFPISVTNVFEQPSLNALGFSTGSLTQSSAATVNITNATATSTLALAVGSLPAGMTLNSGARTITGTPTTPGSGTATISETLADSPNSGRSTNWNWTVAPTPTPTPGTYDPALTPPTFSLVDGITVTPIRLDIDVAVFDEDEYLELRITSDIAGTTSVFNPAPVVIGTGDIVFPGLAAFVPTGEVYIWLRRWNAALSAYGDWSEPPVMWGDATAPTITVTGPIAANDGAKMAVAFTTDEDSTISVTGSDAAAIEVIGSGMSFTARLTGDADLNYGAKSAYSFSLVATDANSNASSPAAISYTVYAPAVAPAWNPSDKSAGFALSNSNRTVTQASGSGPQGVRAVTGRDETTKRYFAVTLGPIAGGDVAVCVANSSASFASYPGGSDVNSTAWYSSGAVYALGAGPVSTPTFAEGDTVGVVVLRGSGFSVCWFLKNGTSISGDPIAETGGFLAPAGLKYPMFHMQAVSQAGTLVLGTPPSGCTAWEEL